MAFATHCDNKGCDSWQKLNSDFPPFLELTEGDEVIAHFCTLWCLTRWGAENSEPTEVTEWTTDAPK